MEESTNATYRDDVDSAQGGVMGTVGRTESQNIRDDVERRTTRLT